jgi:hypothetical protein
MRWVAAALMLLAVVVGLAAAWPLWVGLMDRAVIETAVAEGRAKPPSGELVVGLGGSGCRIDTPASTFERTDRVHWFARYDYDQAMDAPAHVELTHDGTMVAGFPRNLTVPAYKRCLDGGTLPPLDAGEYTLTIRIYSLMPGTVTFVVR